MSLIGSLNLAKSALAVQQAAIQTTSNNISNAGNADYTRQVASTAPNRDQEIAPGRFVGTGSTLTAIRRQIDEALEGRLRGAISDEQASDVAQQWLSRVESVFNELTDQDLSTQLSTFFNSWSNLANKPQDIGLRQIVLQNGDAVAGFLRRLRGDLSNLQVDANSRLAALSIDADNLASQVADLNAQIITAEGTGGQANGLRDQRDAVLKKLSELVDIRTVPQQGGSVINVYVGSEPLVVNTSNRGIALKQDTIDGELVSTVVFKANNGNVKLTSGSLGALDSIKSKVDETAAKLDEVAGALIFELNRIHSSGQGLEGFSSLTGAVAVDDPSAALNDEDSGVKFAPTNGSFVLHVKNKGTGLVTSTLIKVDLDGLNANDTTLASLAGDLDAVGNITATVNAGKLQISADSSDVEFSFSQDSSGALAALGMNAFYTGSTARDIAVSAGISARPQLLAAARNGEPGDNQTALAIAALEKTPVKLLGDASMKDAYESIVNGVSTQASAAKNNAEASRAVKDTLVAQREALSGVSLDEEAVNLMKQQRAFQGAARIITAVNEMMETVLGLVR